VPKRHGSFTRAFTEAKLGDEKASHAKPGGEKSKAPKTSKTRTNEGHSDSENDRVYQGRSTTGDSLYRCFIEGITPKIRNRGLPELAVRPPVLTGEQRDDTIVQSSDGEGGRSASVTAGGLGFMNSTLRNIIGWVPSQV